MIDRHARNRLAEEMRHYMSGLSDNFKFDDTVFDINTKDQTVIEIRKQMWHAYDDLSRHKQKGKWALSDEDKVTVKRFILFLKTNFDCEKYNKATNLSLWPFFNQEQYLKAISDPKYLNCSA